MKRYLRQGFLAIAVLFSLSQSAFAVLPPRYRAIRDLDTMVEFIKEHPDIAADLESINLTNYTIYFSNGCKAIFGRRPPLPGTERDVGPGESLELKRSDCNEHEGGNCLLDKIITH